MKNPSSVTRGKIAETVVAALRPLDFVNAVWEGGAIAFGRLDEWSDVDICVDAQDDKVPEVFPAVESALETLAPIELRYEVPVPPAQGYSQAFYRLKGAGPFLLIDLAVFQHSAEDKLLEPEIHGRAHFHFNKNDAVRVPSLNRRKFIDELRARVGRIEKRFDMFGCFFDKQVSRKNYIEARELYARLLLDMLVEVLRMKHSPPRSSFKTNYISYDLPADVVKRLQTLYFVKDEEELREKFRLGEEWLRETLSELDFQEIERKLDVT
jgi:hypothetical protein